MRKIIRFIYWILMSLMFIVLLLREHRISELNHIDVQDRR